MQPRLLYGVEILKIGWKTIDGKFSGSQEAQQIEQQNGKLLEKAGKAICRILKILVQDFADGTR